MQIRLANLDDIPHIVDIYNQAIRNRNNAIIDDIKLDEYKLEFENRDMKEYPIFVAEINKIIVGWISISPYRANRKAYKNLKEVSFYLDSSATGKGIGSKLLEYVIENRLQIGFHSLFAILVANNTISIGLLKKFGFKLWALMSSVLEMDGKLENAIIYGRNFCIKKGG